MHFKEPSIVSDYPFQISLEVTSEVSGIIVALTTEYVVKMFHLTKEKYSDYQLHEAFQTYLIYYMLFSIT